MKHRWHIVALSAVSTALVACGAKSDLADLSRDTVATSTDAGRSRDAGRLADAGARDTGVAPAACAPRWDLCTVGAGPLLVSGSELGHHPDVTWADHQLLVVYDSDDTGNELVGFDLDGTERFRAGLGGTQAPRIAWNPRTQRGLVVMDTRIRWLGEDGQPSESFVRPDLGHQSVGDPAPIEDGFVVLMGAGSYAAHAPPPLYTTRVPSRPVDALDFEEIHDTGPRAQPEHATNAEGLATISVSSTWNLRTAELWRLDTRTPPTLERELRFPGAQHVLGVVERRAERLALYGATGGGYYLMNLDTSHTLLVGESDSGEDGHVELLGDTVVAAFRHGEPDDERTVVAEISLEGEVVRNPIDLSEPGRVAHWPRLARTPRGLAVVWSERTGDAGGTRLSARLAVLECCP